MIQYFPVTKASYAAADAVQRRIARSLLDAKRPGSQKAPMALLGYEMEATYTVGRRQIGKLSAAEQQFLRAEGRSEFVETGRGGHTTFHGPGQLVLYPVLDLQALRVRVRDYVCILEKSIVAVLAGKYGIHAEQRTGAGLNGVWIAGTQRKVASVGVHVQRSVTTHGLALNVSTDPFWFNRIVACNLPNAQMVSIGDYTTPAPPLEDVATGLIEEIAQRLGQPIIRQSPESSLELLSAMPATH